MGLKRILLIDFNLDHSRSLDPEIEQFEWQTLKVNSVIDASNILTNQPVDLIIFNFFSKNELFSEHLKLFIHKIKTGLNIPFFFIIEELDFNARLYAYRLSPYILILKPYNPLQLKIVIEEIFFQNETKNNTFYIPQDDPYQELKDYFYLKEKGFYHKIHFRDLEMVASDKDVIHIYLSANKKKYTVSLGLKQFQDQFPFPQLTRINKSCVINLQHIYKFNNDYVWINGSPISIGHKFKRNFMEKIKVLKTGWKP